MLDREEDGRGGDAGGEERSRIWGEDEGEFDLELSILPFPFGQAIIEEAVPENPELFITAISAMC